MDRSRCSKCGYWYGTIDALCSEEWIVADVRSVGTGMGRSTRERLSTDSDLDRAPTPTTKHLSGGSGEAGGSGLSGIGASSGNERNKRVRSDSSSSRWNKLEMVS